MQDKKKATSKESSQNKQSTHNNSTTAQRQRLLECLQIVGGQGITTIQAREVLDIISPAPRVHELRWIEGKNVATLWDIDLNAQGKKHRVARYVLLSGSWKNRKIGGGV